MTRTRYQWLAEQGERAMTYESDDHWLDNDRRAFAVECDMKAMLTRHPIALPRMRNLAIDTARGKKIVFSFEYRFLAGNNNYYKPYHLIVEPRLDTGYSIKVAGSNKDEVKLGMYEEFEKWLNEKVSEPRETLHQFELAYLSERK